MSDVRCQMLDVRCQMSDAGAKRTCMPQQGEGRSPEGRNDDSGLDVRCWSEADLSAATR